MPKTQRRPRRRLCARDLGVPRLTHSKWDLLTDAAKDILERGFREGRRFPTIASELADVGVANVSAELVAKWSLKWRMARAREQQREEWPKFAPLTVLAKVDAAPGWYLRRSKRLLPAFRLFRKNPCPETAGSLAEESMLFWLESSLARSERDPGKQSNTAGNPGGGKEQ